MSTYLAVRQTSTSLYAPLAPYWHVSGLAIHPQYQRRGLGALLVREGQRLARGDEGVGGTGVPMVLESSVVARRLYEKCGFEVLREERVGEGWEVCMVWYPEGWRGEKVVV
ncbi:hypothetical protein IAQ61_005428 [Plenodomus lingam]|uniref:uncharacterized protein n=1 Tax=Leptosphaeria maculans TaxID=5022 RepID=UPI00331932A6|nr:hypothetical protein IAQ61_005428 [Plenodomus lingam]